METDSKRVITIREALYHLPQCSTRSGALKAVNELAAKVEDLESEVHRLDHRNTFSDRVARGD